VRVYVCVYGFVDLDCQEAILLFLSYCESLCQFIWDWYRTILSLKVQYGALGGDSV